MNKNEQTAINDSIRILYSIKVEQEQENNEFLKNKQQDSIFSMTAKRIHEIPPK